MKRISLILVLIALSVSVFAQKKEVTSAWNYLRDGLLADAKKSIDKAEANPQTQDWFRTYYYKGQIYQELGLTTNAKYKALCGDNCNDIAFDAYLKSIQLSLVNHKDIDLTTDEGLVQLIKLIVEGDERNFEDTKALADMVGNRLPALSNAFINLGVENFQNHNYEEAYNMFEKAMNISAINVNEDLELKYFTSLAALRSGHYKKAVEYNSGLIRSNYGANEEEKVAIYMNQAQAYGKLGDTVKMLDILQKGINAFPNSNYPLVIETFNYYVNQGESAKAFDYINMAVEKNPNDPQFYVIKGTLLEEMKRKEDAQAEYENALRIDPENFDANYSLGAFYYNTAVDTLEWAEKNIPINEFTRMAEYKAIADEMFSKSLPYLEKSYAQQPKNINVLNTLRTIYYRLGKLEEFEKIKAELDALTATE